MGNYISLDAEQAEQLHTTGQQIGQTIHTKAEQLLPVIEEQLDVITPVIQDVKQIRDTARRYFHLAMTALIIYLILFVILFIMQLVTLLSVQSMRKNLV